MNNNTAKFIGSLTVGTALLLLTLKYFNLAETMLAIHNASAEKLSLALALLVLAYFLRGRRWMIWEPGLKYWDSFKLILVGFMGNNVLPARLGELLRAHCAASCIDNDFGRTATLASIAVERILDGLVVALAGIAGLLLVPLPARLYWALALVCLLFFSLTAALILGIYRHLAIRAVFDRIHGVFPGHLTAFGRAKAGYFLDGLLTIRRPETMLAALIMTCCIWGVELFSYYLIAEGVFPGTGLKVSLVFLAVVNFSSLFPFTVAGLGAIEGATTVFLISAGLPAEQSLAMVLIQHGFQFFFTTTLGGFLYFKDRYYGITAPEAVKEVASESGGETDSDLLLQATRSQMDQLSRDLGILRKDKRRIELSIVIPAYNEKSRLPKTMLETIKWCKQNCSDYEIILVDDGSTDQTLALGRLFSEYQDNVFCIANPHLGKGAAVRSGMLNSSGEQVLFMDADGATPLEEIPKLRSKLQEGYPIAIGSRIVQDATQTSVVTSWHRKVIGRLFAGIVNVFGVRGIGDTQCGFKIFRKEVIKAIFRRQKLNGFAFDVEILFLARKLSLEVSEVPINWHNKEGSKVNLVLDSMKMLRDVLKLKFLHKSLKQEFVQGTLSAKADQERL
jgi:dolichyl-phosphate beta-glucosyltransferase